jgi:hypothetical protein
MDSGTLFRATEKFSKKLAGFLPLNPLTSVMASFSSRQSQRITIPKPDTFP